MIRLLIAVFLSSSHVAPLSTVLFLSLLTILRFTFLGSRMGALASSSWEESSLPLLLLMLFCLNNKEPAKDVFLKNAFVHDAILF